MPRYFGRYVPFPSFPSLCPSFTYRDSICRAPIIQSSSTNTAIFVYATLVLSFLAYGRFVTLVIQDITEYLGIACFQVVKKDRDGKWKDAKVVNEKEKAK